MDLDELVHKSQQGGTKKGLGERSGGKNRIQIEYQEPNSAPTPVSTVGLKPQPFIRFVPASVPPVVSPPPPPASLSNNEEVVVEKTKKEKKKKTVKVEEEDDNDDSHPQRKKKSKVDPSLLLLVSIPPQTKDVLSLLTPHIHEGYTIENLWGKAKRVTLLPRSTVTESTRISFSCSIQFFCKSVDTSDMLHIGIMVEDNDNNKEECGQLLSAVATGKDGVCVLFETGETMVIPDGEDVVHSVLQHPTASASSIVHAVGRVKRVKLGPMPHVNMKHVHLVGQGGVEDCIVISERNNGSTHRGRLLSCSAADSESMHVVLKRE